MPLPTFTQGQPETQKALQLAQFHKVVKGQSISPVFSQHHILLSYWDGLIQVDTWFFTQWATTGLLLMLTTTFNVHSGDAEGRWWDAQYSLTKHFLYYLPCSRGLPAPATPTCFEIKREKWEKAKPKSIRLCQIEFWILYMKCLSKKYKIQAEWVLSIVWKNYKMHRKPLFVRLLPIIF